MVFKHYLLALVCTALVTRVHGSKARVQIHVPRWLTFIWTNLETCWTESVNCNKFYLSIIVGFYTNRNLEIHVLKIVNFLTKNPTNKKIAVNYRCWLQLHNAKCQHMYTRDIKIHFRFVLYVLSEHSSLQCHQPASMKVVCLLMLCWNYKTGFTSRNAIAMQIQIW